MNSEGPEWELMNPSSKRRSLRRENQARGLVLSHIVLCEACRHDGEIRDE
jgi:hypothetical protein